MQYPPSTWAWKKKKKVGGWEMEGNTRFGCGGRQWLAACGGLSWTVVALPVAHPDLPCSCCPFVYHPMCLPALCRPSNQRRDEGRPRREA